MGVVAGRVLNFRQHTVNIRKHIVIPEFAGRGNLPIHRRTVRASSFLVCGAMLPTVELDDDLELVASKIGDVRSDLYLPAEM